MIACQEQWRAGLMDCDTFQRAGLKTQYSIIPQFHYSNCERSELSSYSEIASSILALLGNLVIFVI
jgi:hypothetical protein